MAPIIAAVRPSPKSPLSTAACFILGFLLFGIMLLRVAALPRAGAVLLTLGAPLLGLGPLSLPLILPQAGSVLFGAGQIWLGVALYKKIS